MGTREITGVYKTAADIDTDTIITARDYRKIKRYVMRGHF